MRKTALKLQGKDIHTHFNLIAEMQKSKQHKKYIYINEVCIISEKKKKKKYENIPAFMFLNTKLQCNKRSFCRLFFVLCCPLKQVKF